MSVNEDGAQASSDSFWEVGKYMRTVNRVENGHKLCTSLRQLLVARAEIEKSYSKQLSNWSKKWNEFLDRGAEYGTTQGAWRGVLEESEKVADLHNEVGEKLVNKVTVSIKQWQKENYRRSMMHFKESKDMEDQFKKVQKPWEKKLNKVLQSKKDYHLACKQEKSTSNQECNARNDSAMSHDALKKLQEKLKKGQIEVESTHDKYNACLIDLNGSNAKYIEEMTEVFNKCQDFERRRIDFVKKIMYDIHQCLDLSVEPRYSQIYTDLHTTVSRTNADDDLRWWSHNHGADMAMAWPIFEEYAPELQAISKKEKKTSHISHTGEGGITITSIKPTSDSYVPNPTERQISSSSSTQESQNSHQQPSSYSYNDNSDAGATTADIQQNNDTTPRQDSYDESLNPFGGDDAAVSLGENNHAIVELKPIDENPPINNTNPFGDADSDLDDKESQGSAGRTMPGDVVSVPVRVLYTYAADEDDEIGAEAGEVITRVSEQDDMGWIKAIGKGGKMGLIPGSYIEDISGVSGE